MIDIYHLPKSDHSSWHRKRHSNNPRFDDEVLFQSPCNDMAISFPGSNTTACPWAWQRSHCPPPGKASIVKCAPYAHTPPPPPGLYIDMCITMVKHWIKSRNCTIFIITIFSQNVSWQWILFFSCKTGMVHAKFCPNRGVGHKARLWVKKNYNPLPLPPLCYNFYMQLTSNNLNPR